MFKVFAIYGMVMVGALLLSLLVASWKNRDASRWAFWSFLFPPALLLLAVLPALKERPRKLTIEEQERREYARDDSW